MHNATHRLSRATGTAHAPRTRRATSFVRRSASEKNSEPQSGDGQLPSSTIASALIKSMQELYSKLGNSRPQSTNLVLGTEPSETAWRALDKQVNVYPLQRDFKAVGRGEEGFKESMVAAVESVVGKVHVECISVRYKGQYQSITIGPVWVENSDQVVKVYRLMREDSRLKFYL